MKKLLVRIALVLAVVLVFTTPVFAHDKQLDEPCYTKNAKFDNFCVEEKFPEVPVYYQIDYKDVPYGEHGTVANSGCAIVCFAMVATYLKDQEVSIVDLAEQFGEYNTPSGTFGNVFFPEASKVFNLDYIDQTRNWNQILRALENRQVVIAYQSPKSIFTDRGHFIVLTGLTNDGKIKVNDPTKKNWTKNEEMIEGFANGFRLDQIEQNWCFLYGPKKILKPLKKIGISPKYKSIAYDSHNLIIGELQTYN